MWLANLVCVAMIQFWVNADVMSLGKIWWALAVSRPLFGTSSVFFSSADFGSPRIFFIHIILGIHGHTGRHRRHSISIQNWYLEDVTSVGGGGTRVESTSVEVVFWPFLLILQ